MLPSSKSPQAFTSAKPGDMNQHPHKPQAPASTVADVATARWMDVSKATRSAACGR